MKNAGTYNLDQCVLQSVAEPNKETIDITSMIPAFDIEESISNDCIRGSISVIDTAGILENYPLRGEERMFLSVSDSMDTSRIYDLFVYKIDNVAVAENNSGVSYVIYFTSYQRWEAGKKSVVSAYDTTPTNIAKDIYKRYYDTGDSATKDITIEDISEYVSITIPNVSPMRAMAMVAERTHSSKSRSNSFRFFESAEQFNFVSDEFLLRMAVENKRVFPFTYAHFERSMATFNQQMHNFDSLRASKRVNSIESLTGGLYRSKTNVMDLNYGIFQERRYEYNPRDFFANAQDRHSEDFIKEDSLPWDSALKFYTPIQYDETSQGSVQSNQNYPDILMRRNAYRKHLGATQVVGSGAGRLDITCGDIIELEVGDFSDPHNTPDPERATLSGIYIVHSVTKKFDRDTYVNSYVLTKRGWGKASVQLSIEDSQNDPLNLRGDSII